MPLDSRLLQLVQPLPGARRGERTAYRQVAKEQASGAMQRHLHGPHDGATGSAKHNIYAIGTLQWI